MSRYESAPHINTPAYSENLIKSNPTTEKDYLRNLSSNFRRGRKMARSIFMLTIITSLLFAMNSGAVESETPTEFGQIPPNIISLTLPTGKLQPYAAGPGGVSFMDLSRSSFTKAGGVVITYEVQSPPVPTGYGSSAHLVRSERVDCPQRTVQQLGAMAYSSGGDVVMWLDKLAPKVSPGKGRAEEVIGLVCGGTHQSSVRILGYRAAIAFSEHFMRSQVMH